MKWFRHSLLALLLVTSQMTGTANGQSEDPPAEPDADAAETVSETPEQVDVEPVADDSQIAKRLSQILEATDWFGNPSVRVEEGVVFLSGTTRTEDHKAWAGKLAGKTQDVVAIVNRIRVDEPDLLDFKPALAQLKEMARATIQAAPTTAVAIGMLVLAWFASQLTMRLARLFAQRRISNSLLRGVVAKAAAIPVLLLGAYLALRVSGLTRLAATVLGGTGLLGIVIGIAFRDIAENFLASILISVQRPFHAGDLVTIDGRQGFVQAVTTRGTQLMTLDGNHVQIPNSIVYKSVIENATANPNVRLSFVVGVDYADSAAEAQQAVVAALRSHDAVLTDPEPLVLLDELATSTVNLKVFFWVDGEVHSVLKVRSAVLRRVKRCLQSGGYTLPDESREMIFPQGVPVMLNSGGASLDIENGQSGEDQRSPELPQPANTPRHSLIESNDEATDAEGGLKSERHDIEKQAATSRQLDDGEDLLKEKPH